MANAVPVPMAASARPGEMVAPGQPGIMSFFKSKGSGSSSPDDTKKPLEKPALDEFSQRVILRAKMANAVPAPMTASARPGEMVAPGQPGIMSFFKSKGSGSSSPDDTKKPLEKPALDEFSQRVPVILRAKMANAVPTPMAASARPGEMVAPGQPSIMAFFKSKGSGSSSPDDTKKPLEKPALDEFSQRGKFGWVTLGETHLPCILRHPEEKYCAVRMVESHLLSKFPNYPHEEIYNSSTCIHSFCITEAEARLLNEINFDHCVMGFGPMIYTTKDRVVKLKDVHEFYNFLNVYFSKLLHNDTPTPTARTAAMPQTPSQAQQQPLHNGWPGLGGQATYQPTGFSPPQAQQARMTHTNMAAMQHSTDAGSSNFQ